MTKHEGILPGVGSVLYAGTVKTAIAAGAEFIVTPTSKREIIDIAHSYDKPVLSDAFSPTEILRAYEWGVDVIKLFPSASLGFSYFKAVKAPKPNIPIMPTSGITTEDATDWIKNGDVCLGVKSTVTDEKNIEKSDFATIKNIAKCVLQWKISNSKNRNYVQTSCSMETKNDGVWKRQS